MTHPRFRLLASGKVQQTDSDDQVYDFDPDSFATYTKGDETVQAVRIPRPFIVAGSLCKDGWLVLDGTGLKAVGNQTFSRDYRLALVLGAVPDVEAA